MTGFQFCDYFLLLLCHSSAPVFNMVSAVREPRSAARCCAGLMFSASILRILFYEKQKARSGFPERAFLNVAPLTGIAFASNWLISKLNLNLKSPSVKTTRMTTNNCGLYKDSRNVPQHVVIVTTVFPAREA